MHFILNKYTTVLIDAVTDNVVTCGSGEKRLVMLPAVDFHVERES